jgi:hypothetical protein
MLNDSRYFEPPQTEEITKAYKWHEIGEHEDTRYWAKQGCDACQESAEVLDEIHFAVDLEFDLSDLANAELWAKQKSLKYEDKRHLLWDWITNQPMPFRPVVNAGKLL